MATINIVNGTGTSNVVNGTYAVTANVSGYDNSKISPNTVTIAEGTNTYPFTIAANGTLTLTVTDDGTGAGTPVEGAVFFRTDSEGTTYGNAITTNAQGQAVFDNVPYGANAPAVYFKQTESAEGYEFDAEVQSVTLATQTETENIRNTLAAERTFTLYDANYENLPVNGTITLENNA